MNLREAIDTALVVTFHMEMGAAEQTDYVTNAVRDWLALPPSEAPVGWYCPTCGLVSKVRFVVSHRDERYTTKEVECPTPGEQLLPLVVAARLALPPSEEEIAAVAKALRRVIPDAGDADVLAKVALVASRAVFLPPEDAR